MNNVTGIVFFFPQQVLLRQVSRKDLPGIFPQELLEDGSQGNHRFACAQLRALHHTFLVIDKEVSTAGQDCSTLLRACLGWALCSEVSHEPVDQFTQIPAHAQKSTSERKRTNG